MRLPHNVEQRFLGSQRSTAPYRGWDGDGEFYFIAEEDNNRWVARGRDNGAVFEAKTLGLVANKLANYRR